MNLSGDHLRASAIDDMPLSSYQLTIIVVCSLVAMIDGFDTQAIAFVAPDIAKEWQVPISSFGPVFGAGLFGALIGALIAGSVSDRIGRKPGILLSLFTFGLTSLLMSRANSLGELTIFRFIAGLGLGGAMPSIIALTTEYTPRRKRTTFVAAMFCGFPFGASLGAAASAWALPNYGWKSVFLAGGVLPLLLLPIVGVVIPESLHFLVRNGKAAKLNQITRRLGISDYKQTNDDSPSSEIQPSRSLAEIFRGGRLVGTTLLWLTFFLSLLLSYFLVNWIPSVTRQAGLITEGAVGAVAVLNIGGIIGCFVLSWCIDKFNANYTICVGYLLGALAIVTIGLTASSLAAVLISVFVAGFFSLGAQLCVVAVAAVYYPQHIRATGVAWTMGIGRIGAVVGPVLGGLLIAEGFGPAGLFAVAGLASLLAGVAVGLMELLRSDRKPLEANSMTSTAKSAY
ncbi:MFS transporter [uncultured Bradyrhizobium sp.]|uniref:MFS transporter n=1 Tax=Bradyrhizobium sp. TaxID=376 RepID=UPI00261246B0|nr:MFS transporter [uncultured Bradyrhizobium sp.]